LLDTKCHLYDDFDSGAALSEKLFFVCSCLVVVMSLVLQGYINQYTCILILLLYICIFIYFAELPGDGTLLEERAQTDVLPQVGERPGEPLEQV
jgi:hypothetical protein